MSDSESKNIVWIVGAGFSAHLGAPLLRDLFTPASADNLVTRYPQHNNILGSLEAQCVHALYRMGLCQKDEVSGAIGTGRASDWLWENAEDYLEYTDIANSEPDDSPRRRRLLPMIKRCITRGSIPPATPRQVAAMAKRLMAAECSAFLADGPDSSLQSERWAPYRAWWNRLEPPGHTIISFNYDLVIEYLDTIAAPKLSIFRADGCVNPDTVSLVKLHGSVDWKLKDSNLTFGQKNDFPLTCEDGELAIACPGPSKQRMVRDAFNGLWTAAERELENADAIVFVGYRFPPTDSEALSRLLTAISANSQPHIALHIVLGPHRSDDVVRLEGLLGYAAAMQHRQYVEPWMQPNNQGPGASKSYTIIHQPLWAQDFLLVAKPAYLLQPFLVWRQKRA